MRAPRHRQLFGREQARALHPPRRSTASALLQHDPSCLRYAKQGHFNVQADGDPVPKSGRQTSRPEPK